MSRRSGHKRPTNQPISTVKLVYEDVSKGTACEHTFNLQKTQVRAIRQTFTDVRYLKAGRREKTFQSRLTSASDKLVSTMDHKKAGSSKNNRKRVEGSEHHADEVGSQEEEPPLPSIASLRILNDLSEIEDEEFLDALDQIISDTVLAEQQFTLQSKLSRSISSAASVINITHLDLQHTNLQTFPSTLLTLTQLESLNISHNGLSRIPTSLTALLLLHSLDLSHNKLTCLPHTMLEKNWRKLTLNPNTWYPRTSNLPASDDERSCSSSTEILHAPLLPTLREFSLRALFSNHSNASPELPPHVNPTRPPIPCSICFLNMFEPVATLVRHDHFCLFGMFPFEHTICSLRCYYVLAGKIEEERIRRKTQIERREKRFAAWENVT